MDEARLKKIISLIVTIGKGGSPGEKNNAASALTRALDNSDDVYELSERLRNPALNPDEVQKIHDESYWKGHAVGAEQGRRSALVAASPIKAALNTGGGGGVNGYEWSQIVEHCYANLHVFYTVKEREFIESLKEQFDTYRASPTTAQATWLRDLFMRKFNGRIK